ncbi:glycosyltransferase [Poriferisphaera sp. WC338]|uniref:glycosyltransferase n=1 Tax=Poriferisphaera sp. WC338 TaxID=3425129 RepID=UPI003D81853C
MPVYNEAGVVGSVFNRVRDFAAEHERFHFLFVDDGSSDATVDLLEERIARSGMAGRIRVHALGENRGKGYAIRAGIRRSIGEKICFTDGDLAYSLDHLLSLEAGLDHAEVVIGSRALLTGRQHNISLARKVMGRTFNLSVRLLLGLPYLDTQAGLKGFRRGAAEEIFSFQRVYGFAFDVELIYLARKLSLRVMEVPAEVCKRHSYKVSKMNLVRDPLRMLSSIAGIRFNDVAGKYAAKNSTEFRCGGVRPAAGVRGYDL